MTDEGDNRIAKLKTELGQHYIATPADCTIHVDLQCPTSERIITLTWGVCARRKGLEKGELHWTSCKQTASWFETPGCARLLTMRPIKKALILRRPPKRSDGGRLEG
jgi:hypothetical protein